ncbi:DNA-directed RNA polymerase subunit N [Sulfolobus sp. E5-1-F]|uniref:DNA-directed RNA polymerase subunit N n=1 Tax=Sulfolobaceae TaxID=118883 RepID=UPI0012963780|nr:MULTISPECIES: DNA-directed RNA polymerase subunit N [unclassified Sulfolobus]QGA55105.1 DNA-directed RNA polymerase subunit N [Sulfolobus sp. E5-1-F]QGA67914.1 DNA-directed RNA polymerase subunit N [Sulfolobus sp. E11-6]
MMIPIRCFTCGSLIADKWQPFITRVNAGENPAKVLDELGVKRYCCRRMLLSHIDIINEVIHYTRPI